MKTVCSFLEVDVRRLLVSVYQQPQKWVRILTSDPNSRLFDLNSGNTDVVEHLLRVEPAVAMAQWLLEECESIFDPVKEQALYVELVKNSLQQEFPRIRFGRYVSRNRFIVRFHDPLDKDYEAHSIIGVMHI